MHLVRAELLPKLTENSDSQFRKVIRGKVRRNSPYGFVYEKGKAQRHPQEYPVFQIILELDQAGMNSREIGDQLNQWFRPGFESEPP